MAITILDETIGSVSTLNTFTVYLKSVPVSYDVEYNSSSYTIDMVVRFLDIDATGERFIHFISIEDGEINFRRAIDPLDMAIYDVIYNGVFTKFPSLPDETIKGIAFELRDKLINRLNSFDISLDKIEL